VRNEDLSERKRANISGWLKENQVFEITTGNVGWLLDTPTPSFHERADKILLSLEQKTEFAGQYHIRDVSWVSSGWCINEDELDELLEYLESSSRIQKQIEEHKATYKIIPNGWAHLEDLKKTKTDSNQCFVAMWFNPNEMGEVYEEAIRPAIEYKEDNKSEPRFKAIKIDNVEHINDINDEIIANIRRSRFMVCDLTGYRGGVYFEAGFAYGLGMPVIYTCRKDWCSEDKLRDADGQILETLKDSNGRDIRVRKEGVHFDLAHRNRIEWVDKNLEDFKIKLQNRIKAVII